LPAMYTSEDRAQAAGLIQSQDFDTVFMGTSLAVHYRASEVSERLGVRAVKLAMAGSTSLEQSFVLAAALKKKPKLVVWQMDDWIFRNSPDIDTYVPTDYYRRNLRGIAGYLLGLGTLRDSMGIVAHSITPVWKFVRPLTWIGVLKFHNESVDEINTLPSYFDFASTYNSKNALNSYALHAADPVGVAAGYQYDTMVQNFERDAVTLIQDNPDVRFRIFFPPYSILQFVSMKTASPATFEIFRRFSRYSLIRLAKFPNVELFDFRDAAEITHNLDLYMDVIHHSHEVDLTVLSNLRTGHGRVDPNDPDASIERLTSQVDSYRLPKQP
jgi:hypothetical protein